MRAFNQIISKIFQIRIQPFKKSSLSEMLKSECTSKECHLSLWKNIFFCKFFLQNCFCKNFLKAKDETKSQTDWLYFGIYNARIFHQYLLQNTNLTTQFLNCNRFENCFYELELELWIAFLNFRFTKIGRCKVFLSINKMINRKNCFCIIVKIKTYNEIRRNYFYIVVVILILFLIKKMLKSSLFSKTEEEREYEKT